ncbi:MAG: ribosome biogenesis GTPase YlqF [Erysipelotrichaceae bacterium]|nr:ribosome biogenesis GTPase YlqF [Erysipelotrichaceae bacterium]MDD6093358.1 ribosome biogenesis GTPase YlqF [bacterium]
MNENKVNINWYPGHMAKTKREVKEKLDLIDIVFEVIDARIPYSSKNKDIDSLIKNKPRILIMTKMDLCDLNKTKEWIKYYESIGYKVITLDLLNNPNLQSLTNETNNYSLKMNQKRKEKGLKERKIRALILGIPNVGKSTLINRLVGKKATNVGNKPGITKQLEWIRVNNQIELLDTPGILWPRLDNQEVALNLAATTAIKEEILNVEDIAIYIINKMLKEYPDNIKERYNLTNEEDIIDILDNIGKKIGAIRNKETDYDKVYITVLRDLRDGRLGKVTFDTYLPNSKN